jgi:hypothetical protein
MPRTPRLVSGIHIAVAAICGAPASPARAAAAAKPPNRRICSPAGSSRAIHSAPHTSASETVNTSPARRSSARINDRSAAPPTPRPLRSAHSIHGKSVIPGWMCGKKLSETDTPENT